MALAWQMAGAQASAIRRQAGGGAGPPTRLTASFQPKRLGASTTVSFTIEIDPPPARTPPPLRSLDFSYPANLGIVTSGLGLAACQPGVLEQSNGKGCPANSRVGSGAAKVEVAFGTQIVEEDVSLGVYAGPSTDGYLHLLILASGREPIEARIVMSGVLLPGHMQIDVPAIPGLPGAGDVALEQITATLGGPLTYYTHHGGKLIPYRPRGIGLPDRCPRAGWPMGATLAFADGAVSRARDVIGCPRARRR